MATKWTEKDKKQVKALGIIVAVLLVILLVALAIPKKKKYTAEETAILSVKYVVDNNLSRGIPSGRTSTNGKYRPAKIATLYLAPCRQKAPLASTMTIL